MTARKGSAGGVQLVAVKRHGAPGYRQGCRCGACVAGERARRNGEAPPPVVVPAVPDSGRRRQGEMERSTRKLIRSMDLEGTPAQKLLIAQAVSGARALDEALAAGRPLSAAHKMHAAAVKALEASIPPPPSEPVDDGDPEDLDLWQAAIHRPSDQCQDSFPVVTPGACGACDAAPGARVLYGRKHPDEPGHGYGMRREQCGCAECVAELAQAARLI